MASGFGLSGFPLSEWDFDPSERSLIVRIASCNCARFIRSDGEGNFPEQEEGEEGEEEEEEEEEESLDSRFQLPRSGNVSVGLEDKKAGTEKLSFVKLLVPD
ncbi:hypothetical protein BHYA_0132g00230 [Botrytis hyacinthi]|uniref:Uncharacterized protein n=1 Tax=Botrytis hyacinthi TaxID=278943 RepID=A0A4Z1GGY1_9HELO|nr:hypothetical protein BHYA_0132g00230 [Botrytis hyacinthi]